MPTLQILGGPQGLGSLEGILALPKQSAGRRSAYPGLSMKAAVLFRSMILDHPFVDGNKRMAVGSTLAFLYLNDQIVSATDGELVNYAVRVARGDVRGLEDIEKWIASRTLSVVVIEEALAGGHLPEVVGSLPGRAKLPGRPLLDLVVFMIQQNMEGS